MTFRTFSTTPKLTNPPTVWDSVMREAAKTQQMRILSSIENSDPRRLTGTEPRNEGRVFQAWCGWKYMFVLGTDGRLHTKPYTDGWMNINWGAALASMTNGLGLEQRLSQIVAEAREEPSWRNQYNGGWQTWQNGEARRDAKRMHFLSQYAGSPDHGWDRQLHEGNWTPPEEGEGRMTVSKPPFTW